MSWPVLYGGIAVPILVILLALIPSASSSAQGSPDDATRTRAELEQLTRDITAITAALRQDASRRDALQEQLRAAETDIAGVRTQITATEKHIAAAQAQLAELTPQRSALQEQRDQQRLRIAGDLRRAWEMGDEGQVKMLLNQERPDAIARMTVYYRYLLAARNRRLAEFRQTLEELVAIEEEVTAATAVLERERSELRTRQQQLLTAQAARERAVSQLAQSIRERGASLAQMQRDREELEALLSEIEVAVKDLLIPANYAPFTTAKGNMPWPVVGKHDNRFGAARNQGKMRWQGINIAADRGTTVQAIHHGRVVFADWLRGSGLLLVIDHGEGFMSLYAHNESLLREVGEWVSTGMPISKVGASGGLARPALYFEIRQGGKPTDPAAWCAG